MAEGWLECPVLGPGWKRRESFRKSGASCGRSDTYYQSPTGERIRSKVELIRYLGPDCDLACFDFRHGVLQYSMPAKASQKKKKRTWHRKSIPSVKQKQPQEPRFTPPPPQDPHIKWCENCGVSLLGDNVGRRRLRSLCHNCRARRNAFNREQRMFKRVGCGDCTACRVTEDCGVCTACVLRLPRLPRSQCARRRCLKITNKSFCCGLCAACQTQEDCGICQICKRKGRPDLKRQWKCLQRRCLKKRIIKKPLGLTTRKRPGTWRRGPAPPPTAQATSPSSTSKKRIKFWGPCNVPASDFALGPCLLCQQPRTPSCPAQGRSQEAAPSNAQGSQRNVTEAATAHNIGCNAKEPKRGQGCPAPSKPRYFSRHRQSRRCGACAACQRCVDCGQCDFCQDKPKFGGSNQKRQKCRWRQCLQFAMKRLLPTARWDSPAVEGAALPRCRSRRRKGALVKQAKSEGLQGQRLATEALSKGLEEYECPGLGVYSSPTVKQEPESYEIQAPGTASPPSTSFSPGLQTKGPDIAQLHLLVKQEENAVKEEEEEEITKADLPVIMQIYSLSGVTPIVAGPSGVLDSVLQEFLEELNELPLPAHWEVVPSMGPDICIVQRSPLSTMTAAVIHIQPGLYFYVVVQDTPVPPSHELYLAHPLRLTTVDEVVELICNLEAYHVCPGWSGIWQGSRSPDCDVLVYEGRCQACSIEPCTSGISSS